jgi:hypothetical protein
LNLGWDTSYSEVFRGFLQDFPIYVSTLSPLGFVQNPFHLTTERSTVKTLTASQENLLAPPPTHTDTEVPSTRRRRSFHCHGPHFVEFIKDDEAENLILCKREIGMI